MTATLIVNKDGLLYEISGDMEMPIDMPVEEEEEVLLPDAFAEAFEIAANDPRQMQLQVAMMDAFANQRSVYVEDSSRSAGIYVNMRPSGQLLRCGKHAIADILVITPKGRLERGWIRLRATGSVLLDHEGRRVRNVGIRVLDGFARVSIFAEKEGSGQVFITDPESGEKTILSLSCIPASVN